MARKPDFGRYFEVLKAVYNSGGMPSKYLDMSRQLLYYYLNRLEEMGFIRKFGGKPRIWKLTPLGEEAIMRGFEWFYRHVKRINGLSGSGDVGPLIHVHAIKIRVPVLHVGMLPPSTEMKRKGNLKGSKTYFSTNKFRRWLRKYHPESPPFTLQITESHSGYSVLIHMDERTYRVRTPEEVEARLLTDALRAVMAAAAFLARYGWELNSGGLEIVDHHIAVELPHSIGRYIPRGVVSTGEPVRTPTGIREDREAKIWTDGSPFPHTLEMHSMTSLEDFLLMGKRIRELREELAPTVRDIYVALHEMTGTIRDLSDAINTLKVYMGAPPHNRVN